MSTNLQSLSFPIHISSEPTPNMLLALVLAFAGIAAAAPAALSNNDYSIDNGFVVTHNAADYFPHAAGDISRWDIAVGFTGYNASMKSWLTSLDPHTGATDDDKAKLLLSVAYAKPFDNNDESMVDDKKALLGDVSGETVENVEKQVVQRDTQFIVSASHVVVWHACAAFFSCVSGTSCSFSINVGKAPRSQCQSQGGQNCCISWSTYNVQAGFFTRTWTNCNQDVSDDNKSSASCEGKGDNTGGDVCLSNRATGCT